MQIRPSWGPHIYCMHHFRGRQCRYPAISPSWGPHLYCMHHFKGRPCRYALPGAPIYTACTILGGDNADTLQYPLASWGPHIYCMHHFKGRPCRYALPGAPIYTACTILRGRQCRYPAISPSFLGPPYILHAPF